MDYPFENLSPEKFQLFCQALLVKEHSGMQCFPIAQPDGGRDASQQYFNIPHGKEFAMFQVKFIRNPSKELDPHKLIISIVEEEAPKVKKLIPTGAKRFILITNVSGTAHPEVGSIDKVNQILSDKLGIPSICYWRNDLCRRLDNMWDIKWAYPELMTGPDLIRFVIEENLSESKERRAMAIRTFVTNQFLSDQYVKFKQVDLENRLLDLFIDVPINIGTTMRWSHNEQRNASHDDPIPEYWTRSQILEIDEDNIFPDFRQEYARRSRRMGAATFLLGNNSTKLFPFTVIEGAPGQGKSTIAQYLCQVNRMRLLDKNAELQQIPENHRNTALRLPIKVDLRDFAVWLTRRNPFTAETEEIPATAWDKSLEKFLSALICNQSGGAQFDVSDLHAIARLSSILLVLDGLDEVADIKRREEVIAEIVKGTERLRSICASLQVVVTSRPAAFENSPGLPENKFRYLSLNSVTHELIDEYAAKWLKARRLDDKESMDVKRILREKLSQPHLRDLARNPMQLAILLTLIHTRGVSLPDKRTALYDNYIELFFNRESEKSIIVRENRDLLIDIHRYLAWLLHTESEQMEANTSNQSTGAIEESRLKAILREYLTSEGRDANLADELFTGLIERVVALVSRVQGTYEFEVQPLREYFAARYLHETAPYSPVGNEKRGTRPDRFDAIARNFYWLNVTRFYAGCYSKGELASLIERLGELIRDPNFRYLSHPRILGATLLGDWVFTQHPKSVSQVVHQILDGLGLRFLLSSISRRQSNSQPFILPSACGKSELLEKCFFMLRDIPPKDFAFDVIDLLSANTTRNEVLPLWKQEIQSVTGIKRTAWLEYGLRLGCVSALSSQELDTLLNDDPLVPERIEILLRSRHIDYFTTDSKQRESVISALLDRSVSVNYRLKKQNIIEIFSQAIDATRYAMAFMEATPIPLSELLNRYLHRNTDSLNIKELENLDWTGFEACREIVYTSIEVEAIEASSWATDLAPWEKLISIITKHFGNRWAVRQLANVAAGIKAATETCTDCPDLYAEDKSLCRRARYARLRAGTPTWWSKQIKDANDFDEKIFCCLLYFTWTSAGTILHTLEPVEKIITNLTEQQWYLLFDLIEQAINLTRLHAREKLNWNSFNFDHLAHTSPRILALLRLKINTQSSVAQKFYKFWLAKNDTNDCRCLRVFQRDAIEQLLDHPNDTEKHLNVLSAGYKIGLLAEPFASHQYLRLDILRDVPVKLATKIIESANEYPSFLVAAAERRCRIETAKSIRPVGKVAQEEKWFNQC